LNNKIVDFLKTLKFNLSLTIAPEVKDNLKYVSSLSKFASLSLGHSNASYDLSLKSFNLGIKRITHLYNQITPFHHRNLGIVNAAFDSQVTCELVCDLFHVKKQVINNTYKMIGADRLIVVSDSLSVKGLKNGFHSSQYMDIYKTSKVAYLKDKQTMAGSIQPYNEHLLNFIKSTNCG
jgi:N-acetylglucosamine-6-phosphate deacetylase